jgi:hypothetical protein
MRKFGGTAAAPAPPLTAVEIPNQDPRPFVYGGNFPDAGAL